jgi:hypothetical protein
MGSNRGDFEISLGDLFSDVCAEGAAGPKGC